jgi:hypothetical protein
MSEQLISSADDTVLELGVDSKLELLSAELTSLEALDSALLNSELVLESALEVSELMLETALDTCELTLEIALLRLETVLLSGELVLTSPLTSTLTSPLVSIDWASAAVAIPMPAATTTATTELGFIGVILACERLPPGNRLGHGRYRSWSLNHRLAATQLALAQ